MYTSLGRQNDNDIPLRKDFLIREGELFAPEDSFIFKHELQEAMASTNMKRPDIPKK
jgi:hypothetical protein